MSTGLNHGIELIGAPSDAGAGVAGADQGPRSLREAGLLASLRARGWVVHDAGDLTGPPNPHSAARQGYRHLAQVSAWSRVVCQGVTTALERGRLPLLLGGDHSLSIGSISAVAQHCRSIGRPLRVLWFDAHADCNSRRTSPSANLHGMPVACLRGVGPPALTALSGRMPALDADQLRLIGVRSVDPDEGGLVRELGLHVITMATLRAQGVGAVMAGALDGLASDTHLHVSLDLDFLDPTVAPGTGTAVSGGATLEEARDCLRRIAATGRLASLDVMELNPARDPQGITAQHAVDLVCTLLDAPGRDDESKNLGRA
jgi:arginase